MGPHPLVSPPPSLLFILSWTSRMGHFSPSLPCLGKWGDLADLLLTSECASLCIVPVAAPLPALCVFITVSPACGGLHWSALSLCLEMTGSCSCVLWKPHESDVLFSHSLTVSLSLSFLCFSKFLEAPVTSSVHLGSNLALQGM